MVLPARLDPENAELTFTNSISLKMLPRSVRKVARHLLMNDEPQTLKQACETVKVNYDSFKVMTTRLRTKGIDFQSFIDEQSNIILKQEKLAVNRSLVNGAVSGSHNHQKLYYQLTGDLKESVSIGQITLAIGINVAGVIPQDDRDQGVIDVEPVIPAGK